MTQKTIIAREVIWGDGGGGGEVGRERNIKRKGREEGEERVREEGE